MFRLVAVSKQNSFAINCLNFTDEYPLLITCGTDGSIHVLELLRNRNSTEIICIAKFIHLS